MSGAYVPYHLRLNKAVERKLFIDLLSRIDRCRPIDRYRYISFGGAFLEDFKQIHNAFGISSMISIENDAKTLLRQEFNKPFSCIECLESDSQDFVSEFVRGDQDVIIWLDYADPKALIIQLDEFSSLLAKLEEFDVLKITLNANPTRFGEYGKRVHNRDGSSYLEPMDETHIERLKVFSEKAGDDYLPNGVTPDMMARAEFPALLNRMVEISAEKAMKGRASKGMFFQHLSSYVYADSDHQMLTVSGVVLSQENKEEFYEKIALDDWGHGNLDWGNVERIQIPTLSAKEKMTIDSVLHHKDDESILDELGFGFDRKEKVSKEVVANYRKFYRYYPNFKKIEI